MLLRFGFRNHLSIRDQQEISLVASSLHDNTEGLIPSTDVPGGFVLPAAVIYGANASGKSNIVSAFRFMRTQVMTSHTRPDPNGPILRSTFALDSSISAGTSEFSIDFIYDSTKYHYGFEVSDTSFISEWLFAFPSGRRQVLFERSNQKFSFGRQLKGRNRVISDLTRPNSLFISTATQNDHEELSRVSRFFRSMQIDVPTFFESNANLVSNFLSSVELDPRVIAFLSSVATGIVDYKKTEVEFSNEVRTLMDEFEEVLRKHIPMEVEFPKIGRTKTTIQLGHRGVDGSKIFFDLERESSGTRRLLMLLVTAFAALDNGSILIVDELDASLHTLACEAVLGLFCARDRNPKGAQLIATTHDTNLLRSDFLRRDQVWFTEKDGAGSTHVYPLTDIRTRQGDNIEKGYLQGRFGAVPYAGSFADLLGRSDSGPAAPSESETPSAQT